MNETNYLFTFCRIKLKLIDFNTHTIVVKQARDPFRVTQFVSFLFGFTFFFPL